MQTLQSALNELVANIKQALGGQYSFADQTVTVPTGVGWTCIAREIPCGYDNHDDRSSEDTARHRLSTPDVPNCARSVVEHRSLRHLHGPTCMRWFKSNARLKAPARATSLNDGTVQEGD
jgi:hypothetical protein